MVNDGLTDRHNIQTHTRLTEVERPLRVEQIPGSASPVEYRLAPTMDGLYTTYALRLPAGDGPHPFVFVAYGNGGGALDWLHDRITRYREILDRLLAAGYACAWGRYRTEVDNAFNTAEVLRADARQGQQLFNRSPLEFEDEVAILRHVATDPRIDAGRLFHIGVSHAGEMLFKIGSQFHGLLRAGVACEPANHEFLAMRIDDSAFVNPDTGLRHVDEMQMAEVSRVMERIDLPVARRRIAGIDIPMLVMGRDDDHLQGIFRASYDLMAGAGKDVEWVSWDHPIHGYIFPVTSNDAVPEVDEMQAAAISGVIAYLDRYR